MSVAAVANALIRGTRWLTKIGGVDPVEELRKKFVSLAGANDLYAVVHEEDAARLAEPLKGFKPIVVNDRAAHTVLRKMSSVLTGYEDLLYVFADTPLLDTGIAREMALMHREEFAEYTYGEGFPAGVAPEIVKTSLLPRLASLVEKDEREMDRDSLFQALSKEINSFDVETYFAEENLKLRRIDLSTSLKRNGIVVERVVEEKGVTASYRDFCDLIANKPHVLRTVPVFVEIELTTRANGSCVHSPLPFLNRAAGDMDFESFAKIVEKLKALSEDVVLSLSYLGEPLLHTEIGRFVEWVLSDHRTELLLETDGQLFSPALADFVAGLGSRRLHVIFDVDAVQDETYRRVRGGELRKVERNIRYLISKQVPNVYVQMVRMDANEGEMLQLFDVWEGEGAKVIIQKFNSFLGLLPDLARYDLKPLDRMPCWHLLRDMVVFRDGRVPRCKQDLNGLYELGNLLTEDAGQVWEKGLPFYLQHCAANYDERCAVCDEFFTYNF